MTKHRVIQVVEDLPVGGLETTIKHITNYIDPLKFEVRVCCLEEGGTIADEIKDRGHIVDILGLNNYYNPMQILALTRYFKIHRPDIVHTHGYFASTFGRLAAYLAKVPVIIRQIQNKEIYLRIHHKLFEFILTRLTEGIIAVSKDSALYQINRCHVPPQKIVIVPNGVDTVSLDNAPSPEPFLKQFGIDNCEALIGCIGRLVPIKGHIYMIRSMPDVLKRYPQARLLIIGDGPEKQNLFQEAIKLSISEKVIFTGMRRDIESILKSLRVFVQPSTTIEGLPLSITEAMYAGVPVVASEVGGVSEIVRDEETGLLVTPKNPKQLSMAILRLLDNPKLTKKLLTNSFDLCKKQFSIEIIVKKIEIIYEALLSTKSKSLPIQSALSAYAPIKKEADGLELD
jgi:glycosyltransferase involved in cell wall biosynthesis